MFSRIYNAFKSKHVLLHEVKNAAVITLNRPEKMNSFTAEMTKQLYELIKNLETSEKSVVVITGAGGKAFCSGIDLVSVSNFSGDDNMYGNFDTSNAMDAIKHYQKPYVAIIDGITMGGASFYSMTAKYRVATERTIFAMPETAIGFYTNAGSSYFLSRLKSNLGQYIALTGARITGHDLKKIGLASHYIESKNISDLIEALGDCKEDRDVSEAIEKFSTTSPSKIDEILPRIDKCFDADSVEEIYENLHLDGSEWAQSTIRTLNKMCPTSLKICHQEIKLGKDLSLRECLKMEHRLTVNIFIHHDKNFMEGIRAVIIDKDMKPNWSPDKLTDVKKEDVDKVFEKLPEEFELKFERKISKL